MAKALIIFCALALRLFAADPSNCESADFPCISLSRPDEIKLSVGAGVPPHCLARTRAEILCLFAADDIVSAQFVFRLASDASISLDPLEDFQALREVAQIP